ncbi:ricin-type beta-trefoil lectin domain protein [Streptomyces sp. NPDC019443]|uniref:ricin-type beta-trefoil lectin domain protein n=1 Tax=Streptomyces sp. NPDC019443 TaxID=3365061 RepID=UPI0037BE1B6A
MPKLRKVVANPVNDNPDHTVLPDAKLTERIRAGAPTAYPATQELKRRHMPSVLTYALLCGRTPLAGNQLAVQALDLATQETCRGIEPRGNWGHDLLMAVQRVGMTWASGSRRSRLEPGFAAWIDDNIEYTAVIPADPPRPHLDLTSAMLTAFHRLPEQTRGILWYGVVDEEPDATVATFANVLPSMVPGLRTTAQDAMRKVYIQAYLERGGDRKCLGYRRIIEAAARPGDGRRSEDLALHLAECPSCARLVMELRRMTDSPRTVIADGLLRWRGAEYVARGPVRGPLGTLPETPDRWEPTAALRAPAASAQSQRSDGTLPGAGTAPRNGGTSRTGGTLGTGAAGWPSRLAVLVAVATTVVVAGTVLATAFEDSVPVSADTPDAPQDSWRQEAWPPAAVPAPTPSSSDTRRPSKPPPASPSPSSSSAAPTAKAPAPPKAIAPPRPMPIVAGGGYAQVVNADSGLCLDIVNGVMANRTEVITAPCSGAATQRWKLDPIGVLRSRADPDYCLDSRGDTDRGVGIWTCSSVYGKNGPNLRFTIDAAGAIRPQIAPSFALEPLGGSAGGSLDFDPADGDSDQRWTAGSSVRS